MNRTFNVIGTDPSNLSGFIYITIKKLFTMRYKPDVVILQKTKMENVDREIMNSLCHFSSLGWSVLPSVGASRGILMFWNKEVVVCEESWVDNFFGSMLASVMGDTQKWVITGVYGPTSGNRLVDFIAELQTIRGRKDFPWYIGGILMRCCT